MKKYISFIQEVFAFLGLFVFLIFLASLFINIENEKEDFWKSAIFGGLITSFIFTLIFHSLFGSLRRK